MAQRINVMTPEGSFEYLAYDDNRELAADFAAGVLAVGRDVVYRGAICEIVCDFLDDDGMRFCELLVKSILMSNHITINM